MKKLWQVMMRITLWVIIIFWICFFSCKLWEMVNESIKRQDQQARERYENEKAIVLVKFEIPKEHQLYLKGEQMMPTVYMNSRYTYKLDIYKGGELVKSVMFKPKSHLELSGREVVDLR